MSNSEYEKKQDGSVTTFNVKPASCPANKGALIYVIPFLFIGLVLLAMGTFGLILYILFVAAAWYLGFHKDWRPAEHRRPSTFSVSTSEITSNGRTFRKEDIHRLLIRNGMKKNELTSAFIAKGGPATTAIAVSHIYRQKISAVTNSLDLESGGNAYTLAGGMSETTAFGLMTDVSRALGFHDS